MKRLSDTEMTHLKYFIKFCDGMTYRSGGRDKLFCGSGQGRAFLGTVFRDQAPKNTMAKALRRGLVERVSHGGWWKPTDAGHAALKEARG